MGVELEFGREGKWELELREICWPAADAGWLVAEMTMIDRILLFICFVTAIYFFRKFIFDVYIYIYFIFYKFVPNFSLKWICKNTITLVEEKKRKRKRGREE